LKINATEAQRTRRGRKADEESRMGFFAATFQVAVLIERLPFDFGCGRLVGSGTF
jgi:hypothetical protein